MLVVWLALIEGCQSIRGKVAWESVYCSLLHDASRPCMALTNGSFTHTEPTLWV